MPVVVAAGVQSQVSDADRAGAVAGGDCAAAVDCHISERAAAAECAAAVYCRRARGEAAGDEEFARVDRGRAREGVVAGERGRAGADVVERQAAGHVRAESVAAVLVDVHCGCAAATVNCCGGECADCGAVTQIQRASRVCCAGQCQQAADGDCSVFREVERAVADNSDREISAVCPDAATDVCYAVTRRRRITIDIITTQISFRICHNPTAAEIENACAAITASQSEFPIDGPCATTDICYADASVRTAQGGTERCGHVSCATKVERAVAPVSHP